MLTIGFIMSSSRQNYKPFRNQPLSILYLLTILEERCGDRVHLSYIDLRGVEEDSALYHIQACDVFLYSVATPDFVETVGIVQNLRSAYPKAKHIAGGPHITLFPDECSKIFDVIAVGEGEESIVSIVNDILALDLKPIYRQGEAVNLNSYPYPSRKYLPRTAVVDTGVLQGKHSNLRGTNVLFSRGCPFNCHYCANKDLKYGPVRFRSPELITEEIEYLKYEYQIEALALKDDNGIPVNVRVAQPFLEAIGRTGVKWRGQSRANGVHPDMVKLAYEAGCTDIGVGLESVVPEVQRLINKNIDIDKAKEYLLLLKKTGIGVRLNFMFGLPGEPEDIVQRTLAFIDEIEPSSVLLSILTPLPKTELFNHPEIFGIKISNHDWRKFLPIVAGRFSEDEQPDMVFEYDRVSPWGKAMSREKILQNYIELQTILRERGLNF